MRDTGLLLLVAVTILFAAGCESEPDVVIYVTDFGIRQWNDRLELGSSFEHAKNRVYPEFDTVSGSQILVPMPASDDFDEGDLALEITAVLREKILDAAGRGVTKFEVQFVQRMTGADYFNEKCQATADRFGAASYRGVGQAALAIRASGTVPSVHAIVGSNGVGVLARNVAAAEGAIHSADLFDGRATEEDATRLIEALDAGNVRIYTTKGDLPSTSDSVARGAVGRRLKERFPGLGVFRLDPLLMPNLGPLVHISGMSAGRRFRVEEYDGEGYVERGEMLGAALRPK